jgi:transaldolase / glucose-6-phosphate isomerase
VSSLEAIELVDRIWARDPTVWTGTDEAQWLGWLDEPARMLERVDELEALPGDFDQVVLLGMGGSSLAPEVIRRTFGATRLHVLDTTHPTAIRRLEQQLELDRTLFVAASKSGTTLETRSQLAYFMGRGAGSFAAITDPGTELEQFAHEHDFAWVVQGEPTIGGRYSALSPFGIVPAVLIDLDAQALLERADAMAGWCRLGEENPGFRFGLELGENWVEGRDKVCIDETPGGFGLWAEQLLAESTGKQGRGLVPAPGEDPDGGPDRQHGRVRLDDPYDLGAEFFRWEFATAIAGSILGINPFNQPDVQAAKDRTAAILSSGHDRGTGPQTGPEGSLDDLLAQAEPPQYIAIQAFIDPEREGELDPLVVRARDTGCVVTKGLGPRYLHSTGQLHKGGPNNVLAIQVVDDFGEELEIPGRDFGFRQLIAAQAAGDLEALKERGRKVCRVRLEEL